MNLRKVLILHKKSTFQIQALEHKESRFLKLLAEESSLATRVKKAHDEHIETLQALEAELTRRHIDFTSLARSELTSKVKDVDLVIAVGGDGTFLDASHFVESVPVLGVNSSKSSSFGHFCLATEQTVTTVLDEIVSNRLKLYPLLRLELVLNGAVLPDLVLNEVLVAHKNPAATSRYFIALDQKEEEQKSSGVLIGPPSGSTGTIRSCGGAVLPITDTRFQYLVREPCLVPGKPWHLLRGILPEQESIRVISHMRTGMIYVDGPHIEHRFDLGDELIVRKSRHHLKAYVLQNVNDIFL